MNKERFEYIIARYLKGMATEQEEKELLLCIRSSEATHAAFKERTGRYCGERDAETDRKWNRIASVILPDKASNGVGESSELDESKETNESNELSQTKKTKEWNEANEPSGLNEANDPEGLNEPNESDKSNGWNEPDELSRLNDSKETNRPKKEVVRASLSSFSRRRRWFLRVAAVFLLCVGGLSFFFLKRTATGGGGTTSAWLTIAAVQEDRTCTLPDGTSVYLRRGSSLRYPGAAASFAREVSLSGEAFFEVTSDAARPFVVDASGLRVKVLGTAFSVRTAEKTETISVTLVRGSVSLNDRHQKELVRLVPDQRADYSVGSGRCTVSEVDGERLTSWRKGIITYDNASLDEVVRLIEQTYGVSLRYDPPANGSQRFSGAFLQTQKLDTVLELTGRLTGTKLKLVK